MTLRGKLMGAAFAVSLGLAGFFVGQGLVHAANLSDEAPHPGNSSPNDAHVFIMRRSSNFGKNPDVQLVAYYPKDTSQTAWKNGFLRLRPGGGINEPLVCQTDAGGLTAEQKKEYITIKLDAQSGETVSYHIPYGNACNYGGDSAYVNQAHIKGSTGHPGENENRFFATYPLPGNNLPSALDADTNRYKVYVTISYNNNLPENIGNTGNTVMFDVKGNTANMKIGQLGGGDNDSDTTDGYSFPLRADYQYVNNGTAPAGVDIPFGLPCNVTGASKIKKIGLYDADNGSYYFVPHVVRFKLKELKADGSFKQWVQFEAGSNFKGSFENRGEGPRTTFRPNDGEAAYAWAKAEIKTQTNYVMVITGIDKGNIIDVHVPGDTIFGTLKCGWEMHPESLPVDKPIAAPGDTVTFTHTVQNKGNFRSDDVTRTVRWGQGGRITSGDISSGTAKYDPDEKKTFTNTFPIPGNARDGWQYCQYITAKPKASNDNGQISSRETTGESCVTVQSPPPDPPREVNIQPVVNGITEYVEPTETARFDGYVNITGFPQLWADEWGYTEVAKQRPAQRVAATASGGLETDGPHTIDATPTTTYSCPHANDTRSGSTCTHTYGGAANDTRAECQANGHNWSGGTCTDTHAANSSTSYSCPATYVKSGTTCSRVRYKCSNSSTWGAWNAAPPSCPQYWTCPGGAAGSGWYYAAPNCQGWKCQYAPYTQVNQATAPPCEYRCSDGTGLRAPQSNGWTGDMNCYVQPRFTLTCYWKNKPQFSETVTGNGRYCNNRDADADEVGVTIGTPVRAVLTANYPGNGAWSSPPPGYGKNSAGVWGWHVVWGWNNFPSRSAEDTVRVVGKPTVKVFGGDVSAGGGFVTNGVCGPSATSMIAGWPHIPAYDAAGTQFGAFSSGSITGFSSAMINANSALAPRSLAFANTPASSGEVFGGSFGNMDCALDHYGDATPTSLPNVGLSSINSNPTTPTASGSYRGSGTQIGHNPVIRSGQRIAVYVTGNVYISGNGITYQNRGGWQTVQDIPAFKLVVYGGNIYIAPSVTELSGIYVAQPNGNVGGEIYTCANNGSTIPNNSLYGSCRNLLTVNGAFIAKKIHLQRTEGTAIRGETAERFNYLPEVWLAPWPQTNAASNVKYDAIISLPPVL